MGLVAGVALRLAKSWLVTGLALMGGRGVNYLMKLIRNPMSSCVWPTMRKFRVAV